jgi:hypothetical protein
MSSVQRGAGFPFLAIVLGGVGAVFLFFGSLGMFAPQAAGFMPMLREPAVATALLAVGAVFTAIELLLLLPWLRRRALQRQSE